MSRGTHPTTQNLPSLSFATARRRIIRPLRIDDKMIIKQLDDEAGVTNRDMNVRIDRALRHGIVARTMTF